MQIQVIGFGILKEWLGADGAAVELPDGATVAMLLGVLETQRQRPLLRGLAVGVNQEFVPSRHILKQGDEVALLPPVSGGTARAANCGTVRAALGAARPSVLRGMEEIVAGICAVESGVCALTVEAIDGQGIAAAMRRDADGALVVFDGVVRNQSHGRQTLHLDYEAYEEMALKQMEALRVEACRHFEVRAAAMVHRLGRLKVGECSVLIVVASAHRAAAFEACRWLIDSLKKSVPIWKRETFVDGAVWAAGEPFPEGMAVEEGCA
jgi:molybdopterin synthase catalytic subunit/molybdopterin converting factor small subunit